MTIREQVHQLVDALPDDELEIAGRVLARSKAVPRPSTALSGEPAIPHGGIAKRPRQRSPLAGLSALSLSSPAAAVSAKAPADDEPVTAREADAIAEGERDFERGRVVTAAELRAHFGL